jgi:hypothetical protein
VRFNDPTLNFELQGDYSLSKSTPLVLQKDLFISKENYQLNRDLISFNELIIELAPPNALSDVRLQFTMKPYLKPQEELLDLTIGQTTQVRRPVRLREPITFNIEPMASKVKFRFEVDENKDQALVGDFYHLMVNFEQDEDITL